MDTLIFCFESLSLWCFVIAATTINFHRAFVVEEEVENTRNCYQPADKPSSVLVKGNGRSWLLSLYRSFRAGGGVTNVN